MMESNPFSIRGKTILVTGASSGIGRAVAVECARLGALVIACGRNEERLSETMHACGGEQHRCVLGDLTNPEDMSALVTQVGALDGVVFCAGKGMTNPFLFNTREKLDSIFNVNFFAPIELMRLLVKKKRVSSGAALVFILSIAGIGRYTHGNSAYGATKAALNSMLKYTALELKSKKIRVNGICPGMITTPLISRGTFSTEQRERDMAECFLGRYGKPEEVAYAAVYLLSDATAWMTGQSVVLDGGASI